MAMVLRTFLRSDQPGIAEGLGRTLGRMVASIFRYAFEQAGEFAVR